MWRPPWTFVERLDTTPEAAARERDWWLGLTGAQRAQWWLRRNAEFEALQIDLLMQRHPGISRQEARARWVEQTYAGTCDAGFLAKAAAAIRAWGADVERSSVARR